MTETAKGVPKITITGFNEVVYIKNLIEIDIRNIEANLNAKQKLLKKFKDKLPQQGAGQ